MNSEKLERLVDRRIRLINNILVTKAKEYANGEDRLHNFTRAAQVLGTTRAKALMGMATKHFVSILDLVEGINRQHHSVELIEEKIGDMINYLILLEAVLKEDLCRDITAALQNEEIL